MSGKASHPFRASAISFAAARAGSAASFTGPGKEWTYYRCSNPSCRKQKATASYVEASFAIGLAATALQLQERLDDPTWAVLRENADSLSNVETTLAKLTEQTDFILDRLEDGILTKAQAEKRLADLKERREELEKRQRLLADDGAGMRNALAALFCHLIDFSEPGVGKLDTDDEWAAPFLCVWGVAPVEYRRALVQLATETVELREGQIVIHFRAGLSIPVPIIAGRREQRFAPALEALGFGKPRNLADYGLDEGSSSSHASTAPRRAVGAFSQ